MWIMWGFATLIPISIIVALATGEITVGGGTIGHHSSSRIVVFSDEPIKFILSIVVLCVLEWFLVRTLLAAKESDKTKKRKKNLEGH